MKVFLVLLLFVVFVILSILAIGLHNPNYRIISSSFSWKKKMLINGIDLSAEKLLGKMTLYEKIDQMSGDGGLLTFIKMAVRFTLFKNTKPFPIFYSGRNSKLEIPTLAFSDGPRGVTVGHATTFPVAMGRGASWDRELESRIGDVIGKEIRASNANFFGGLCINLLRHPSWGRAQETYGEDS